MLIAKFHQNLRHRQHTIESAVFAIAAAFAASGWPVQSWTFGEYDSIQIARWRLDCLRLFFARGSSVVRVFWLLIGYKHMGHVTRRLRRAQIGRQSGGARFAEGIGSCQTWTNGTESDKFGDYNHVLPESFVQGTEPKMEPIFFSYFCIKNAHGGKFFRKSFTVQRLVDCN